MRLFHEETKEYEQKLEQFRYFCLNYQQPIIDFYVKRSKELFEVYSTKMPGRKGIAYCPEKYSFIIQEENGKKQHIPDEVFGSFSIIEDPTYRTYLKELKALYKPGLVELLAHGDTYHAMYMSKIIQPHLDWEHKFRDNFRYLETNSTSIQTTKSIPKD